ncbi:hypothetical protein CN692_00050 [Bacillus sp. AFS002410]|nr:hypothetical protein CN692_00050 [Bacillus sp. AFS002410]
MGMIARKYKTIFFFLIIIVNLLYITVDNTKIENIISIVTLGIAIILYFIKTRYDRKVVKKK